MPFYLKNKTEKTKKKEHKPQTVCRVKDICREKEMEKSWCLWRGFLKDLGEGAVGGGQPNLVLLKHPHGLWNTRALFSPLCWLMTLWQQPTDHLRGGLIQSYRGKQRHWKQWLVWNYLTCFPCFKELLLRQQQLAEDWVLLSLRFSSHVRVEGVYHFQHQAVFLHPPFLQIPMLP